MKTLKKSILRAMVASFVIAFSILTSVAVQQPVRVEAAAKKVSISKKKATIDAGKKLTLTVKNANAKVVWSSSNKKVAKVVSKKGAKKATAVIKGVKKGTAVITAKVGKKKLKVTVKVKNHTHDFVGATCTRPETCSCGATRGIALGHVPIPGNCRTRMKCSRCGSVIGSYGAHSYNLNHVCTLCHEVDIRTIAPMYFTYEGGQDIKVWIVNRWDNTFSGDGEFNVSSFKIYPVTQNGNVAGQMPMDLTTYMDDNDNELLFGHEWVVENTKPQNLYQGMTLRIPSGQFPSFYTPRLEFDFTLEAGYTSGLSVTMEIQTYHISIIGNGDTGVVQYTRTR